MLGGGGDEIARARKFGRGRKHRQQNPRPPEARGAQNRPRLPREKARRGEAKPDRAQAQSRILRRGFDRRLDFGIGSRHFVGAQIERAKNDRQRRHFFENRAIDLKLLLFAGQIVAVQKQKLGAKQADSVAARGQRFGGFVGDFDVRVQAHGLSVYGAGALLAGGGGRRRLPRRIKKAAAGFGVGAHHDRARVRIDN